MNSRSGLDGRDTTEFVEHVYQDGNGVEAYKVRRYDPKGFCVYRAVGGEWVPGLDGGVTFLYRLPEVVKAIERNEVILVVEGEKDVESVQSLGLTATCNPFGAGRWKPEFSESLRGADAVVIPDNDEPGEKHALKVVGSLRGTAKRVRLLHLPGLPDGGDLTDWIARVGSDDGCEELLKLIDASAKDESPDDESDRDVSGGRTSGDFICLSDVVPEEVEWIWKPYLPLGKLTLMVGRPGVGKSYCSLAIATCVSLGTALPFGEPSAPGIALVAASEDGIADTIRPRIGYMNADLTRVLALRPEVLPLMLPDEIKRLEDEALRLGAVLIIIDPFMSFVGNRDVNSGSDMRVALDSLSRLAAVTGAAVLVVHHPRKGSAGIAADRIMGSVSLPAAARSVLFVGSDPNNPDDRALVQIKMNLSPPGKPVGFEIKDGLFYWKPDTNLTAERMFDAEQSSDEIGARDEAVDFLMDALSGGPRPAKEVEKDARELGISTATLRAARRKLNIKSKRHSTSGSRGEGHWEWRLPTETEDSNE